MSRFICCIYCLAMAATLLRAPGSLSAEGGGAALELRLDEVINDVVRYNPLVLEAYLRWRISSRLARAAWGDFDPELVASYDRNSEYRENTVFQMLQMQLETEYSKEEDGYGLGIEGNLLSGGNYRLGMTLTTTESNLAAGTEYQSFVGLSAEQPLLKGFTHGAPLAGVRTSARERKAAYHNYRKQLMSIVSQAESAYWNLAFVQEEYRIASESVEIARNIARDSREWFKAGKMSELDLLEAEAGLEIRLAYQADREQEVLDASTQLKLLLSGDRFAGGERLEAVDPLITPAQGEGGEPQEPDVSVEWALNAQPDYLMRREELAKENILLDFQKDQRLPELNLKGSYGVNGLGDSISESLGKIENQDYSTWSLGLEMRIPLFLGIRERNELQAARLKKELAEVRLRATEYEIINSIEGVKQRIATLRKRINNARRVVELKKRLMDLELLRLEAGRSTIRQVYETEDALAQARELELESVVRYREAVMHLALVSGTVLRDKGLEFGERGRFFLSKRVPGGYR